MQLYEEKNVYQLTAERLSQPAVTWHIMGHIIRQSKMTPAFENN